MPHSSALHNACRLAKKDAYSGEKAHSFLKKLRVEDLKLDVLQKKMLKVVFTQSCGLINAQVFLTTRRSKDVT